MPISPIYEFSDFGIALNRVLAFAQLQPMSDADTANLDEDNPPPLDSFGIYQDRDVADAYNTLLQTSTTIQANGYPFNTIYGHKINPTIGGNPVTPGNIVLPNRTLGFRVPRKECFDKSPQEQYSRLGNLLYDNIKETELFSEAITLDIIVGYKFINLMAVVREYITVIAGYNFQIHKLGSESLHRQRDIVYINAERNFKRYVNNLVQTNLIANTDFDIQNLSYRRTYFGC
jgi:hypothetical protein